MPHATGLRYLPWFPIAGGSGDGETPPADPPSTPPTSCDTDGQRDAPRFTQAQLATAVQDALRREREKAEAAAKKSAEDAEAKKLAAQQEWQQLAEKHEKRAAAAEQQRQDAIAAQRAVALRYEVRLAAQELGFTDPSDAHRFLDINAVETADDGTPTNVRKLLEDLVRAKPYLVKTQQTTPAGVPATPRAADARQYTEQQQQAARTQAERSYQSAW